MVSAVGGSFSLIAVPTQLFTMTGSSAPIGIAAAVSLVTIIVAALWTGTLADALDRRQLLLVANAGLGLAYLGLWTHSVLAINSVPVVLLLVALQGLSFGATMTTMGAALPRVVPAELLVAANSLSSLVRNTGALVGPMLAGVLIPVVGLGTLYLLDAVALLVVLWAVGMLPPLPVGVGVRPPGGVLRQLGEGVRYLARRRVLMAVLAVDFAAMALAMPVALFPELAEHTYGGPPGGGVELGLLYAAYPGGVLLAGLLSGTFSGARRHGALMASAAVTWGCCVLVLGASESLWLALAALVGGGAANIVLSTFRNAISQAYTDDALRGRIQGLLVVVLVGGPQVANVLHGLVGSAIGARWTVGAGGLLTVVAVVLIVRIAPELWRYERQAS